jgi:hypothetical protein
MISRIINEPFSLCTDNFAFHILLGPRHAIRAVCRDEIQPVCGRQVKRIIDLRRTRIKRRSHLDLSLQLLSPSGTKTTLKAGPEVVNFNQIQVGDRVKATVAEQIVVFVRKNGEPPRDGEAAAVALAPVGAKPGLLMANTVEVTAAVQALDLEHRKATLRFPDGTSKAFKVRKDVDMTKARLGDEVVIRTTEAMAITVEKP